ncbi:MAG: O-acetyl-ADP-ribose deacetylase [Acidithiobacillales bacterium]
MADPGALASLLGGRVVVRVGDITRENADAIVNAANSSLLGGGGVDGAIHRAAGPSLLLACREVRRTLYPDGLPAGDAVATAGGNLRAKYVIHTAGPVWGAHAGGERQLLASCYTKSLAIAAEKQLETVAFPAISTGVYGFPREEAAAIASLAIADFLADHELPREVRLIFFVEDDAKVFLANKAFEKAGGG